MSEEWTEWFSHDGRGCPVVKGTLGEAELRSGRIGAFRALCGSTRGGPYKAANQPGSAWVWGSSDYSLEEVLRYRIRKPRSLRQLRELVETIPAPEKERQDA